MFRAQAHPEQLQDGDRVRFEDQRGHCIRHPSYCCGARSHCCGYCFGRDWGHHLREDRGGSEAADEQSPDDVVP